MKHFAHNSNTDQELFKILLMPSVLSFFVSLALAIGLVAATVFGSHYRSSDTRLQLLKYLHSSNGLSVQNAQHALDSNRLISNLPLLLFWILVGLIVYLCAINLFGLVREAADLRQELTDNVNAGRSSVIREVVEKLAIRIVVLAVTVPYILVFFHRALPYAVALSLAASNQLTKLQGIECIMLALVLIIVCVHVFVILLRLLALRPRLLSRAVYVD